MLIRLRVSNFLSFDKPEEFNMLTGEYRRLKNHVFTYKNINVLKFASVYGANGSGKSNLIFSLSAMKKIVAERGIDKYLINSFKIHDFEKTLPPTQFEIEFISDNKAYIYGFEIVKHKVKGEWLYHSGLGERKDNLIFKRTDRGKTIEVEVNDSLLSSNKSDQVIFNHYTKKVLKSNHLLLTTLLEGEVKSFKKDIEAVWNWFNLLNIILPSGAPKWLLYDLVRDKEFEKFSNSILNKIDTGIKKLHIKTIPFDMFFGEDDKKEALSLEQDLFELEDPIPLDIDLLAIIEDGEAVIKRLYIEHIGFGDENLFTFQDESDGTKRVIEYLVMLYSLIFGNNDAAKSGDNDLFVIDEIERSIHPCLIKALLEKLSKENIKGQMIFSTHESNLLDLNIFRPDEIWFSEKNPENGTSVYYPLSEFEVRTDFNVSNGYLNGRFGAIPFLGNLSKEHWV